MHHEFIRFSFLCFFLIALILFALCLPGCETVPKYYSIGSDGYGSPEGTAARLGMEAASRPFVGDAWATILGSVAGLVAGGFAVYKRKKWIDQDPPIHKQ